MREGKVETFIQSIIDENNLQTTTTTIDGGINNEPFAVIKLYIENEKLKEQYKIHIDGHNKKVVMNSFPDSGFDLFMPDSITFDSYSIDSKFVDLDVIGQMIYFPTGMNLSKSRYSPFLINPRSSISKTPLVLANNVGVIDSAYRGNLIVALRCLYVTKTYDIQQYTRLVQVCHPSYCPILVLLVDKEDIDMNTQRGGGGFGSTGLAVSA
jgi:dUTP pyrophosphatase